jgi:hypothetical protein
MAVKTAKELGVYWVLPTLIIAYLVSGLSIAVCHHLFYLSLHHSSIYEEGRQQWPIRIGSGLTFLTIALFNMAVSAAYTQHVWTELRSKSYSLLAIDQLFALTIDATGLFSKEILLRARSAAALALIIWYAGVISAKSLIAHILQASTSSHYNTTRYAVGSEYRRPSRSSRNSPFTTDQRQQRCLDSRQRHDSAMEPD